MIAECNAQRVAAIWRVYLVRFRVHGHAMPERIRHDVEGHHVHADTAHDHGVAGMTVDHALHVGSALEIPV